MIGKTVLEPPIRMLESGLLDPGEGGPALATGGIPTCAVISAAIHNLKSMHP